MSTAAERVAVFRDTLDWIRRDTDLSKAVEKAKKRTEIFYEDDYPPFTRLPDRDMAVTVTKDRSFQAAVRLSREKPDKKIAVMNFANAFHPGGGVTKGASAQEESLCRTSTLYPLLYRKDTAGQFLQAPRGPEHS